MLGVNGLFSDRVCFETIEGIKNSITKSKNFNPEFESPSKSNALLIFDTSKQKTWLVATEKRLYCVLDDLRKQQPHINWSMKKDDIIQNNNINIEIKIHEKSYSSGLVDISGSHKNWLYSKRLFLDEPINAKINDTLNNSMLKGSFMNE